MLASGNTDFVEYVNSSMLSNEIGNQLERLENENKRLQFIIENFVKEKEVLEIGDIKSLINKKIPSTKQLQTSLENEKVNFSKENIKKFLELWSEGRSTVEIVNIYQNKRGAKNIGRKKLKS